NWEISRASQSKSTEKGRCRGRSHPTNVDIYFDDVTVTHTLSPIVSSGDYYPFGLTFNSYSRENSTTQDYLYNGKELQDELGMGWMDYGARMYMPEIGRWGGIDPQADHMRRHSPYNYAFDNPVRYIDPDGMMPRESKRDNAEDHREWMA